MSFDPARVAAFVLRVGPCVDRYDGWVISYGRSRQRNSDIPGAKDGSKHIDWAAVDAFFYDKEDRDAAYQMCYTQGLHGYKKGDKVPILCEYTGRRIWGFHMQDEPGKAP